MAALSNYIENKLIDLLFRGGTYSTPTNIYIALCTSTPSAGQTGSTIPEVSGGNYVRQAVAGNNSNWYSTQGDTSSTSTGTSGQTGNVSIINWNAVTWNATVTAIAILDAASAGNLLWFGPLASARTVVSGDSVTFSQNTLQLGLS